MACLLLSAGDNGWARRSVEDGGRSYLRMLPVLTGRDPVFDVDAAPADPVLLFVSWLGRVRTVV